MRYHYTQEDITENNKYWSGCEAPGTLIHSRNAK